MQHIINLFKMLNLLFSLPNFERRKPAPQPTVGYWNTSNAPNNNAPRKATEGSAGIDIPAGEDIELLPNVPTAIKTGLFFVIAEGYNLEIRGRSGLAFNNNIFSFNGTIDHDYTGELKVLLLNHGTQPFKIREGQYIAQAVLHKTAECAIVSLSEKPAPTTHLGFGSTSEKTAGENKW